MYRPTQASFNDRILNVGEQTKKALDSSRAKLIGDVLYPNVDEDKFSGLFSEKGSRPNIPIRRYVCALTLKRMYGMSDDVLIEFLRCGALNFQYALHTTQDERQPISESSLRRFRRSIEKYNAENGCDILKEEGERIARLMAVDMDILGKDPDSAMTGEEAVLVRMGQHGDRMQGEAHDPPRDRLHDRDDSHTVPAAQGLRRCDSGGPGALPG